MDLTNMTRSELEQLREDINEELQSRQPDSVSVCGRGENCACFYTFPMHLTYDQVRSLEAITFDTCALLVYGLNKHLDWDEHRRDVYRALGNRNKCKKMHVTRDCTKAFLHFVDHDKATAAQKVLVDAGYRVNFVLKPESIERMKELE